MTYTREVTLSRFHLADAVIYIIGNSRNTCLARLSRVPPLPPFLVAPDPIVLGDCLPDSSPLLPFGVPAPLFVFAKAESAGELGIVTFCGSHQLGCLPSASSSSSRDSGSRGCAASPSSMSGRRMLLATYTVAWVQASSARLGLWPRLYIKP